MISSYKVFLDKKLVIEYHEGISTLEDIKAFKLDEARDQNYSPDYDLLMDVRKATVKAVRNDVKEYIKFANAHKGISGKRKLAVITSTPRHVVIFTFLNLFEIRLAQKMRLFSSLDAALLWLGEPITLKDTDFCINNLKDKARSQL